MNMTIQPLHTGYGTLCLDTYPAKVWLISDPHFDHDNIIRHQDRPFASVEEMNYRLYTNWQEAVAPDDLVLFLGDMASGRWSRPASYWAQRLNGKKVYIKGNHDRGIHRRWYYPNILLIAYGALLIADGKHFLLTHNPNNALAKKNEYIIHGHNHNTRPYLYNWRINVSADVIGFKPISLAQILKDIREQGEKMTANQESDEWSRSVVLPPLFNRKLGGVNNNDR